MSKVAFKKYGLLGSFVYSRAALPISGLFIKSGVGPNSVTVLGFLLFVVGCYLLTSYHNAVAWVGFAFLHLGVMLDYADGIVARSTNSTSFFGGWLDNSIDRLADFIIMLPIAINILGRHESEWIAIVVISTIFSVCFFHYIHDIGYFYFSAKINSRVERKSKISSNLLTYIVSSWLRVFNRDTVVFILSISLLFKIFFLPFIFVFFISCINIFLHIAKEIYRKDDHDLSK